MTAVTSRPRRRGGLPTVPVLLTPEQRAEVEAMLRQTTVERRVYLRGHALLMMADGVAANQIAWRLNVHERTPEKWRRRFRDGDPIEMLKDAPRAGRPVSLSRRQTAHE